MKAIRKCVLSAFLIAMLLLGVGAAQASVPSEKGNPNPGVIPNEGLKYGALGAAWWQWAYSFPVSDVPFVNTGGPVDASAGQSGNVWFLAGANNGLTEPRTATIPSGVSLFVPLINYLNDYPCPDPNFKPVPDQSLEEFLREGAVGAIEWYVPNPGSELFAEIDGKPLQNLAFYLATSPMFTFQADPTDTLYDPCITGTPQPGVASGYWLLLPPLTPGVHTLHFGASSENAEQDVTYTLTVTPGHQSAP